MTESLSIFIAFGAGVLAFLSPCVLPLIPSWLFVIGGSPMTGDNEKRPKPVARTLSSRTLSFVFGFSTVFIVLSIILTVTFNLMSGLFRYINIAAGLIVIILGLNIIFDFLSLLNFEKRFNIKNKPRGIIGAFLLGAAFGAGWTPCIGPVLTGILILAAQSGGIPLAVFYLVFFSAGLGFPFILAAFFFDVFIKFSQKIRKYLPVIQRICGVLLIATGVLILTGHYQEFSALTARLN
jgi:cytochrome c-type biogenesis protein